MNKKSNRLLWPKVILLLLLMTMVNCINDNKSVLKGHWFFVVKDSVYNEMYISDSTITWYSEIYEYQIPVKYDLVESKIRYLDNMSKEIGYPSKYVIINEDKIILRSISSNDTLYRIKDATTLLDSVKNMEDLEKYMKSFYDRRKKVLKNIPTRIDVLLMDKE